MWATPGGPEGALAAALKRISLSPRCGARAEAMQLQLARTAAPSAGERVRPQCAAGTPLSCRCVLSDSGKAICLTRDHKAKDPQEARRIVQVGAGTLHMPLGRGEGGASTGTPTGCLHVGLYRHTIAPALCGTPS